MYSMKKSAYNQCAAALLLAKAKGRVCFFIAVLCMFLSGLNANAQKFLMLQKDTLPLFQGFAVSGDLMGLIQMQLSDYGQYEGALRVNLHNQDFPIVEVGYGKAEHNEDLITGITYRTKAPYFRVGCDLNLMKNKQSKNRIFGGLRYGYTKYKVELFRQPFPDPTWLWDTSFGVHDSPCYQHWAEVVFGIDSQVFGPFHLGWSVRYRRRLAHDDGITGKTWYVPGFGTQGSTKLGATFNVIIDI